MTPGIADEDMPADPLDQWSDERLEREFATAWVEWHCMGKEGATRAIRVHAMHDELVDRGINPGLIIHDHGYTVREDQEATA